MIAIGQYNDLRIIRKTEEGLVLTEGEKEILLPYVDVPKNAEIGDNLNLFVFMQKDGRLQATSKRPLACVGDFACLTVVDETEDGGVFMDIGIGKDIYVPKREQKRPMFRGDKHVVYVFLDESNDRMLASSKLINYVEEEEIDLEEGDEVSLLIADRSDLGYNAIIDNKYIGLLYTNELFDELNPGETRKGWVKKIRVEGKIDLSLQPMGYGHILETKDVILEDLKYSGGVIALGDKSSPEAIYQYFKISKSAFKKAIGGLYKDRLIIVSDHEIRLNIDEEAE
ncbi:putative RNA-binding protein (virulence factor B family) [Pedobacter africanus]|uniref:RNA-binding protein (Virulence factor B family) n=1 Tax=Pedobacter africanus TaxID=151894 RepID=A0ACC6KR12_9SPHI|nr:S1-like domain-containing RNA-binding protein [Pedobacter africanus]MDR6781780.1 putative RNA-binding protein (virulence factor B family) [Pedobacter africanus]